MGKLTVRRASEITKPGRYSDGDGLYLHVRGGGSKQWIVRYVGPDGKRHDMSLGSLAKLTLAQARIAASDVRRDVLNGSNPIVARQLEQTNTKFEHVAHEVWQNQKPTWRNPKHADQWINTLRTYAFPVIGDLDVADVTSDQICVSACKIDPLRRGIGVQF
jgi:Arm DNA-binding domain/Phage integrase central domain